jgi:hypothetical protein
MEGTEKFAGSFSGLQTQEELQNEPVVVIPPAGEPPAGGEGDEPIDTTGGEGGEGNEGGEGQGGEGDEPLTVIDQLKSTYGIDDDLPNEVEGIQQLVEKVKLNAKSEGIAEKFAEKPILAELDKHLSEGKSVQSFFQVREVESGKLQEVALTGDDTEKAKIMAYYKEVIKADAFEKGMSERQVNRILESAELEGTVEEDYKEALTSWNSRKDQEAASISQAEAQRVADEQAEAIETVNQINKLVDAGTIGNAIIPVADRAEFKKFLLEQDAQGLSARDRKLAELGLDKNLLIDYLVFKDFSIKGLVAAPSNKQTLADLNKSRTNRLGGEGAGGNAADQTKLPESLRLTNFSELTPQ